MTGEGNLYQNPYYIYFAYLNQLPVYINNTEFRYVATTTITEGGFSVWSDPFQIMSSNVGGTATGTVDTNGDIDITIDNGNEIDDLKDFMSSQPDFNSANVSQQDIENSLGMKTTTNPYSLIVSELINGLTTALLADNNMVWQFKVHAWGDTISLTSSDFYPQYGTGLQQFLTLISTVFCTLLIVRWVTMVVESINVGDVSKTLELVEEKYSDLL